MNSKKQFGKTVRNTAAALLCLAFAGAAAGCDSLIGTDNEADMSRVIAEVNITKEKDFAEGGKYAAYKDVVSESNGKIYKRDLISAFLSSGYSSVQNGATYKDTFNKLAETLVARKITVQYSMAYFLDADGYSVQGYNDYIAAQKDELKDVEEEKRAQILTLKYFLTDGGTAAEGDNGYDRAVYSLKKAVNSSLDSSETSFMRSSDDTSADGITGADSARTLPTGINTEKDDYYTENYDIYTGYNTPDSCGEYEKQKNSTRYSRRAAYNQFITNLVSNGLISSETTETTDFMKLDYFYVELLSQLEQSMISKFSDAVDEKAGASLTADKVKKLYEEELAAQKKKYDESLSDFESDIGSLSATKFVLYAPEKAASEAGKYRYGYVYNILLPFSATDTQRISAYKNDADKATTDEEKAARMETYYAERAKAADKIIAKDQRTGWFSNDDASNYAEEKDGKWYFFNKYTGNTKRYKTATHYASSIAFDGSVVTSADGKIKSVNVSKNKTILPFVNNVLETMLGVTTPATALTTYKRTPSANAKNDFDWQDFMLLKGKADVGTGVDLGTYFADTESKQYKAVTAVNELVFAYGTDPGMLNSYIGYTVTPSCDKTFVKEFAYAAKEAVAGGVGTYTVCLTDYGWHIMYCNYVYEAGNVYGTADEIFAEANMENGEYKEDTFARYFYDSVKSKLDESSTIVQERMLADYNTENAVTKYTTRYQDLLDMDSSNGRK